MAIYTKHGQRVIQESLRVDDRGMVGDEIVKVWALAEGETTERQYWFSDLRADKKREIRDVIESNFKRNGALK